MEFFARVVVLPDWGVCFSKSGGGGGGGAGGGEMGSSCMWYFSVAKFLREKDPALEVCFGSMYLFLTGNMVLKGIFFYRGLR